MSISNSYTYSTMNPEPQTLVDLLRRNAGRQGDQLAYAFLVDGESEKVELTYKELDQRSSAIGALLQLSGVAGKPVLLLCPPGLDFIAAFLGCLYAGAIAVPAYPPKPNRSQLRLLSIIEDTLATVVLTTRAVLAGVKQVFDGLPSAKRLRWLAVDDITNDLGEQWREPAINGDSLALLQYTSGSTSTPKGVMVSHHNLLSNAQIMRKGFQHTEKSVFVGWLPLYHDMGLIGIALESLFLGARCILMSPAAFLQKPSRWLQAISDYEATMSGAPNFAYDLCVRKVTSEERSQLDLSSWINAFNGSEPVFHETLERFAAAFADCGFRRETFYPCYGLAEGTLYVSGGRPDEVPVVKAFDTAALEKHRAVPLDHGLAGGRSLVSCGNNLSDQRIAIVQPESLTECLEGEVGEIWVSGPSVAQGYWRRPQQTEQTFQAYLPRTGEGPFLRTGDLGFILEGELFITGRLKDLIIIDGENHYPQEIELTVEKSHFALRPGCCAAVSIDIEGRERLVVAAELDRCHRKVDRSVIVKAIRHAVAEQHELRVDHIWLLDPGGIPKTSSGKIQRHACRAGFLASPDYESHLIDDRRHDQDAR
jgi:acyl-CoA synthetase (AMP-forming)/AMP-acid ligase II